MSKLLAQQAYKALQSKKIYPKPSTHGLVNGFIIWQGPSVLDGAPVVAIATGLTLARRHSKRGVNAKTGAMAQVYIIRSDVSPVEARQQGLDGAICGDCKHKSGSCYVRLEQGPLIVYKSFLAGKYPVLSALDAAEQLRGLNVRLGSYGDIAAIPAHILHSLMRFTANNTGYTHQWKRNDMEHLKVFTMASCDTLEEHLEATRKGWRTFLVVPKGSTQIPAKTFLCPASEEAGKKLTCDQCLACNGSRDNRSASVYIPVHGVSFKQKRFEQLIQIGRA
jgi:hypothetical protein